MAVDVTVAVMATVGREVPAAIGSEPVYVHVTVWPETVQVQLVPEAVFGVIPVGKVVISLGAALCVPPDEETEGWAV